MPVKKLQTQKRVTIMECSRLRGFRSQTASRFRAHGWVADDSFLRMSIPVLTAFGTFVTLERQSQRGAKSRHFGQVREGKTVNGSDRRSSCPLPFRVCMLRRFWAISAQPARRHCPFWQRPEPHRPHRNPRFPMWSEVSAPRGGFRHFEKA